MDRLIDDTTLVAAYLREERHAHALIDDWILQATQTFRHRLGEHWWDALQDIRLEIFKLLEAGKFKGKGLKTYVWRVAHHTCIDVWRKQRTRTFTTLEDTYKAADPDPHGSLEAAERTRALLRLLTRVPEECRRLWQMVLEGLSSAQMSAALHIEPGTLRVRLYRCRQKAAALRDTPHEEGPWTAET